jgi:hypothetical protein
MNDRERCRQDHEDRKDVVGDDGRETLELRLEPAEDVEGHADGEGGERNDRDPDQVSIRARGPRMSPRRIPRSLHHGPVVLSTRSEAP